MVLKLKDIKNKKNVELVVRLCEIEEKEDKRKAKIYKGRMADETENISFTSYKEVNEGVYIVLAKIDFFKDIKYAIILNILKKIEEDDPLYIKESEIAEKRISGGNSAILEFTLIDEKPVCPECGGRMKLDDTLYDDKEVYICTNCEHEADIDEVEIKLSLSANIHTGTKTYQTNSESESGVRYIFGEFSLRKKYPDLNKWLNEPKKGIKFVRNKLINDLHMKSVKYSFSTSKDDNNTVFVYIN